MNDNQNVCLDNQQGFEIKNNKFCLHLNEDKSEATLTVYDIGRLITVQDALAFLKSNEILEFDKKTIDEIFSQKKFNQPILIARGILVQNGLDSRIEVLADLVSHINPEINDDGTVDFKNIRSIPTVKKGVVVARKIPPTTGVDGVDVYGKTIRAYHGKSLIPPLGTNVAFSLDDPNSVIAEKSGHILLNEDGLLEIRDILIVDGDVDYSTGNIDFDGTVIIHGDVKTNFKVKADGNIEIEGSVEDSEIISTKSVIVKGGFIGKGHGLIKSDEDVTIHHVNNQRIEALGDIIIGEEALNAELQAGHDLKILGKKGAIIGGNTYAVNKIETRIAGVESGVITVLSAGVNKEMMLRIRELEGLIEKNEENLKKIKQNVYNLFRIKLDKKTLPSDKELLLEHLKKAQVNLPAQIERMKAELNQLMKDKEKYRYSALEVIDTVHAKTRVVMGEDTLELKETFHCAVFLAEKGSVSMFIKGKRVKFT